MSTDPWPFPQTRYILLFQGEGEEAAEEADVGGDGGEGEDDEQVKEARQAEGLEDLGVEPAPEASRYAQGQHHPGVNNLDAEKPARFLGVDEPAADFAGNHGDGEKECPRHQEMEGALFQRGGPGGQVGQGESLRPGKKRQWGNAR